LLRFDRRAMRRRDRVASEFSQFPVSSRDMVRADVSRLESMTMRVLIVDDEPLARERLVRMCDEHRDLDVVAEAGSGAAAIRAAREHQPDVMLLDVELNDMTGFDVLRSFAPRAAPLAIIVTAYPERALEAFETDAIDYLTKPVDASRFHAAIHRARQRCSRTLATEPVPSKLVGEKSRKLYFIGIEAVEYVESDLNYVTIHTAQDAYLSRNTLKQLGAQLAPLGFVRIHRSLLVSLRAVSFAERLGHGLYAFTLASGRRLESGPSFSKNIREQLQNRPGISMSENGQ
jgi:two-component system, LytTR family, response regulator